MTSSKKVIKYLTIFLAILVIISMVILVWYRIFTILYNLKDSEDKYIEIDDDYNLRNLDIELRYTKLIIKNGSELKVETNNQDVLVRETKNKLIVREKSKKILPNKDYQITIYIPNIIFDNVKIEAGAGKIEIAKLQTNDLDFEFGAGYAKIDELFVFNDTNLDAGAGELEILDGSLSNLDLDMGVGKVNITSIIDGNSKIEAGIGALKLNILANKEDFQISVDKGIGQVLLDDLKLENNKVYGTGNNSLKIEGGIGKININFIK